MPDIPGLCNYTDGDSAHAFNVLLTFRPVALLQSHRKTNFAGISSQRIEKLLRGDKVPTSIIFALRLHTLANITSSAAGDTTHKASRRAFVQRGRISVCRNLFSSGAYTHQEIIANTEEPSQRLES